VGGGGPALARDRTVSADIETIADMIAAGDLERASARKVN
jgi:hypothetical protein